MSDVAAFQVLPGMPCRMDLVMSDHQGIEIDYRPKCRGVWFDCGELDKIIERSAQYAAAPSVVPPTASSLSIVASGSGEPAAFGLRPRRTGAGASLRTTKTSSGETANS